MHYKKKEKKYNKICIFFKTVNVQVWKSDEKFFLKGKENNQVRKFMKSLSKWVKYETVCSFVQIPTNTMSQSSM